MKSYKLLQMMSYISLLSIIYRIYITFIKLPSFNLIQLTDDKEVDNIIEESINYAKQQHFLKQDNVNLLLTALLFVLLVLVIYLYSMKDFKRGMFLHTLFLLVRFGQLRYVYLGLKNIVSNFQSSEQLELIEVANKLTFSTHSILILSYVLLILFHLLNFNRVVQDFKVG